MQELFVENAAQLEQLCDALKHSKWLTLDTEFIREKTYFPDFCLLQVSNGEVAACVDPLALDDMQPLLDIIYDENIVKVLHAAFQDLEIFFHLWQKIPAPIFDTQLAAAITGYGDQLGYGKLVQKLTGKNLDKDQSRTDWSRRPLDQAQIKYALDDVIYLCDIYEQLNDKLIKTGRDKWLSAEFEQLAHRDTFDVRPEEAWKKTKGRQHLKGVQYAILQKVAQWREQRAQQSNKPRRWILKDEVLIDLARRAPTQINQLHKIRGMEAGSIKRNGQKLLDLIAQAKQMPSESWPAENIPNRQLNRKEEALVDLLMCGLRLIANQHQITPSAIANRKDLEKLITDNDTDLLQGWRKIVAGDLLLKIRDGELLPQWDEQGELVLA